MMWRWIYFLYENMECVQHMTLNRTFLIAKRCRIREGFLTCFRSSELGWLRMKPLKPAKRLTGRQTKVVACMGGIVNTRSPNVLTNIGI